MNLNIQQANKSYWPQKEPRLKNNLSRLLLYFVITIAALIVFFPYIWMIVTSLSPKDEVFSWPPKLIPSQFVWRNYIQVLYEYKFGQYLLNSFIVAGFTTVIAMVLNSLAGYAFAKLKFPGRKILFLLVLVSIMIPMQITMVPIFIMFRHMPLLGGNNILGSGGTGLINTYISLILPGMATTFGTYLIKEHFAALPWDLLDSGRIDGLSEFKIFWKIYLPLAKPAIATAGIFSFTETWNNFVWPLVLTTETKMRTVQLGLNNMKGQYFDDWHLLMAAAVFTSIPCIIVYILGQKYFTKGAALTGLKG